MAERKPKFIFPSLSLLFFHVCLFTPPSFCGPARAPLLAGQPFLVFWGIPDKDCLGRPNPSAFGMEWEGRVAIFYEDTLGLYPYFTVQDRPVSRGLPQHTSLDSHLQRVEGDLVALLPQAGSPGLGVLRWQEWVPQWTRNRGVKAKYLEESKALLQTFFPDWTVQEVEKWSQVDFEAAAQSIMTETLREVKRLRPQRLWGMAPYPDCYNLDSTQMAFANYTGRCPAAEMALNDELMWLWKQSDALYPILSLEKVPEGTKGAWLYTTNQIREALRIAALAGTTFDLPVFPLIKIVYSASDSFLSEKSCSEFGSYVRQVLGPYAVNVTTAMRLCGVSLCQGRGRCVRKKPEEPTYIHLPSAHFMLIANGAQGVRATGELPADYIELWRKDFRCQWFESLEGAAADQDSSADLENRGKIKSQNTAVKPVAEIPVISVPAVPTKQPVVGNSPKTPAMCLSSTLLYAFIMFLLAVY
ncbi:hypothetical protein DNTS_033038 [Danionella cerebrum]|uniref:Hyaluronidase n=1 Tax=Danionella cerebrum TaxID=2873325 RepID=A0A553NN44_9TELE|nr:hypothetical protein DNTS_033038 [Danionella translucida]TRY66873.1 hypothetical protein DNTS_033038 [Danionella translucida]